VATRVKIKKVRVGTLRRPDATALVAYTADGPVLVGLWDGPVDPTREQRRAARAAFRRHGGGRGWAGRQSQGGGAG